MKEDKRRVFIFFQKKGREVESSELKSAIKGLFMKIQKVRVKLPFEKVNVNISNIN